ncbi:beta-propeller fold lactonase family protein [Sphingomonas turrisvirgatae]|uniref:YVTN family beta-propeller repeat protein n=1 Tax=Sphingomonas turrisvirgatae TaxID=1888892 RepID=UPI0019D3B79E|nr:beta-propeller fold lactonase family protein [Sphingomonas turrisvirgatae]
MKADLSLACISTAIRGHLCDDLEGTAQQACEMLIRARFRVLPEVQSKESTMSFRNTVAALIIVAASATLTQGCSPENAPTQPQTSRASGVVFTADEQGNSISVIDLQTSKVETTPIPISPHNAQTSRDGRSLFAVGSSGGGHDMSGPGRLLGFNAAVVSSGPVFRVEVGRAPAHVIVDPQGTRAFVTNGGDNTVSVIDLAQRQTMKSIAVGKSPHGLRMSPDGGTIYVANTADGTVSVLNVQDLTEVARVPVGKAPVQVAFTPDGRYNYVSLRNENSVAVVDTASRRVIAKVPVGPGPIQLFALPNGREVYVANQGTEAAPGNTVSVIDTTSRKVVANIVTGAGAHGVAVSNSGDRVFVSNIFANTATIIDPVSRKVVDNVPVGRGPGGITFAAGKD